MSFTGFRQKSLFPALALILIIMTACNGNKTDLPDGLYADFSTSRGDIIVELFPDKAPLTVTNFVGLAEGTLDFANKNGAFYDGLTFHRVIDDFMIQGGDPEGTGRGGPGYRFADETDNGLVFDEPGYLAMANAGPDTNGSQFFITRVPTDWLNGKHTIFGKVVEGQDVVEAMEQGDKIKSLKILRVGSEASAYKASSTTFRELDSAITARKKAAEEEAQKVVLNTIASRWPNAVQDEETGIFSVIRSEGTGAKPSPGANITVHYTGTFMDTKQFDSSRDRGEPFSFILGGRQVIPGWDYIFQQMKKGERRIIILPPEMAYGKQGYPPVIPPNSWLVFDVELLDFQDSGK